MLMVTGKSRVVCWIIRGTNEYTVQASSVDEAGNQYSEPQATTFYMPLEPITVAPTDHL